MTRIYLVRHGTHGLVDRALAGRMPNVHLGAAGMLQALRLTDHFGERDVSAILSSPLERCRETAAPIAERLGLQVNVSDGLNEIDCGAWTGKDFDALALDARWQAWNNERANASVPEGETMAAVQARAMGVVEALAVSAQGPAILVSHSDVIKVVIATLLGSPLDWHDRLQIDPGSITTVDLWPGGGKIVRLNEVAKP